MRFNTSLLAGALLAGASISAFGSLAPLVAQDPTIEEYEPRKTLVVSEHPLTRARFPFVDIHGHQRATSMSAADVARLVAEMDELNMAVMVNLSGGSGDALVSGLENMTRDHAGRFVFFANVSFQGVGDPEWGERAAAQLEQDVRSGAAGLKIFKNLGLSALDTDGKRIPVDDPRLAPIWDKAGELGIPVLIHSADPASSGSLTIVSTSVGSSSSCDPVAFSLPGRAHRSRRSSASSTTCSDVTRTRRSFRRT